jgi:hypothetical protein
LDFEWSEEIDAEIEVPHARQPLAVLEQLPRLTSAAAQFRILQIGAFSTVGVVETKGRPHG